MKRSCLTLLAVLMLTGSASASASKSFDELFANKTMRIDYLHTGDAKTEFITLDTIYEQGEWAGSVLNLMDERNLGRYYVKIYDAASNELVFSKGFDTYFGEYRTTDDALKGVMKSYQESTLIPYPKSEIIFAIESRGKNNKLKEIFRRAIDPESTSINREAVSRGVKVFNIVHHGEPHKHMDIAVVAEGYTAAEEGKAVRDFNRFARTMLSQEPYRSLKNHINVYGVFKPSEESGCDEPSHGFFKNTAVDATFDSLGSERYLMTENNKALRDVAAHAPYDALVIMVNHKRYGGGGIYNLFSVFTTDNQWYEYLIVHEFGHSFAGLADEYYTSSTAYNDFYPKGAEPLEPNITAHPKKKVLKWEGLVSKGVATPTPWEKDDFDRMDLAYQKKRQELNKKLAEMKRSGTPKGEVKGLEGEIEERSKEAAMDSDEYLSKSKFRGKVGAFEGAGYSSKGLFRPMLDCIMFTKGAKPFCKVCERAIAKNIRYCSGL